MFHINSRYVTRKSSGWRNWSAASKISPQKQTSFQLTFQALFRPKEGANNGQRCECLSSFLERVSHLGAKTTSANYCNLLLIMCHDCNVCAKKRSDEGRYALFSERFVFEIHTGHPGFVFSRLRPCNLKGWAGNCGTEMASQGSCVISFVGRVAIKKGGKRQAGCFLYKLLVTRPCCKRQGRIKLSGEHGRWGAGDLTNCSVFPHVSQACGL